MCFTGHCSITTIFPRTLVVVLYSWTAYVTCTRVDQVSPVVVRSPVLSTLVLGLYTYYKLISEGPGSPLEYSELVVKDVAAAENGTELPPEFLSRRSITSKRDGRFRLCRTCHVWKPDRCHHCSACNRCILRMDHHCPWLPDCVGFRNQKYFIQFLMYATLYAFNVLIFDTIQLYIWFHQGDYERQLIDLVLFSVWLLAFAVSIALSCFTGFSIYQVAHNQTTIELHIQGRYREELDILGESRRDDATDNVFDLGSSSKNWMDVMGTTLFEWLLPIPTSKRIRNRHSLDQKGLYFDFRSDVSERLLDSMDLQDRLLRRVTPRSSMERGLI